MASYDVGITGGIDVGINRGATALFSPLWDGEVAEGSSDFTNAGESGEASMRLTANASDNYTAEQGGGGGAGVAVRSVPFLVRTTA
jgi:hypothetical protein